MAARRQPDANWEQNVRESFARQGFMRLIGAQIVGLEPGHCTLALPSRADLCQQRGFLHGGVTAALADTAGGYAAYSLMPAGASPLTVKFKTNLLAPALGRALCRERQGGARRPHAHHRRSRRDGGDKGRLDADCAHARHADLSGKHPRSTRASGWSGRIMGLLRGLR